MDSTEFSQTLNNSKKKNTVFFHTNMPEMPVLMQSDNLELPGIEEKKESDPIAKRLREIEEIDIELKRASMEYAISLPRSPLDYCSRKAIVLEYVADHYFGVKTRKLKMSDEIKNLILNCGGEYVTGKRYYRVNKSHYTTLLSQLYEIAKDKDTNLEPIPLFVFHALASKMPFDCTRKNIVGKDYTSEIEPNIAKLLPKKLQEQLFHFQLEGVVFGATHHGRVLIGDEMGVGKTLQALAISYLYREEWPLLIVCPSSLKLLWRDEIKKWLPQIPKKDIEVIKNSKTAFTIKAQVYIMSYDIARNVEAALSEIPFRIAIADEAHYLKTRESARSRILSPILMQCHRVILLTGTPILGKPIEIYNLIHIIRPDLFPEISEFGYRYCDPKPTVFGTDWGHSANAEELHHICGNYNNLFFITYIILFNIFYKLLLIQSIN